jgi:hypothetical protein
MVPQEARSAGTVAFDRPLERGIFSEPRQTRRPVGSSRRCGLSSSSMALDVYAWLAQRLHRIPPGKPQLITWVSMYEQFGQGFARLRDFRRNFLQTLHQVHAAYPQARIDADEVGLTLTNSPPPVPPRYSGSLSGKKAELHLRNHGNLVAPPTSTNAANGQGESDELTTGRSTLSD